MFSFPTLDRFSSTWWSVTLALVAVTAVAGCDLPSDAPSAATEVNVSLFGTETYVFLGTSDDAPVLIDTTATPFEDVFTVDPEDQSVLVDRTVDDFDIGTFDGLFDEAAASVDLDASLEADVVEESEFADQFPDQEDELIARPQGESFATTGQFSLDLEDLRFEDGDFVEFSDGTLRIGQLTNQIDVAFEEATLRFLSVRTPPYEPDDLLEVSFSGSDANPSSYEFPRIEREEGPRDIDLPLDELRFYPDDGTLEYEFDGRSETSDDARTIRRGEGISAQLTDRDPEVSEFAAQIVETLPFPVTGDETPLDLEDDRDVELADLDLPFDDATIDGLDLAGSELTLHVEPENVSTDVDLYAALLGTTDGSSTPSYLSGRGERSVGPGDPRAESFLRNGAEVGAENLIQFPASSSGDLSEPPAQTTVLSDENSTVDSFVSALPSDIRFAGEAVPREDERARARRPVDFDASLGVSVPVRPRDDFAIRDTVDLDLSDLDDLTDPDESARLTEGGLTIEYETGLPLGTSLELVFLDADDRAALTISDAARIDPAPISDEDGTAQGTEPGTSDVDLSEDDIRALGDSRSLVLKFEVRPPDGATAPRVRASDTMQLSVEARLGGQLDS